MAAKAASPGASLLRQSRLFAMPKPLPPPLSFRLGHQDPAPYPTVQAITTPTASRVRGNWGLKRDVPHKITHTTMRVTELDTIERFMTFESANDDVLTVKKWQEIDMPLTKSPRLLGEMKRPLESVFDDNVSAGELYKWKYLCPFLLDMPADEFKRYLLKKVKPRQKEFEAFVAKKMASVRGVYETSTTSSEQEGESGSENAAEPAVNMEKLRSDPLKFLTLVTDFLDMPHTGRPYRTHPSAGLHYTRSSAHIPHDPEHGPRPSRAVPGRSLNSSPAGPVVGIGGVAATLRENSNYFDNGRIHNNRRHVRDYEPRSAYISTRGRIMMDVKPAVSQEEAVGLRSPGRGLGWGIGASEEGSEGSGGGEDAGSVRDHLKGLVSGGGVGGRRAPDGWGSWMAATNSGRPQQQSGDNGNGNGGRDGLGRLVAPKSRFSDAFTRPGQAATPRDRDNGRRDRSEGIEDVLASLTKR
ncbi:hypothetical protein L873DRAFT_1800259 [Choiromyces venosus 120613-1]|uniref:Uncharacterized protein n=1 Tax=Choiromyces venosus 120613-1 TaxID=1336337 RepID=A0A3N4K095_9PEZI|nr:hypothetical protein L873DRAFT_1800259 [Choiromyces venosus 120613-1]